VALARLALARRLPGRDAGDAPLVSVSSRRATRRATSALRALGARLHLPALEVLVVDDHSADGTAALARAAAEGDPRVRVLDNPPLPPGWMGKQWACATGARRPAATVLCFADADTTHAPDLLPRAVNALRARGAACSRSPAGRSWAASGSASCSRRCSPSSPAATAAPSA
jgi:chlorobactene glucosyltransferase